MRPIGQTFTLDGVELIVVKNDNCELCAFSLSDPKCFYSDLDRGRRLELQCSVSCDATQDQ